MTFKEFKKTDRYKGWYELIPEGYKHATVTQEEVDFYIEYLLYETTLLDNKTTKEQMSFIMNGLGGWANPHSVIKHLLKTDEKPTKKTFAELLNTPMDF